ncbi:MAG: Fe-S cluster assembly ATPase SufC [Rhodothermaeota bacterium MED-G12]|nr:Fe-S cluster assembly ATPase SufC [Balneola sp.]MCH1552400.1 Fe-S cluster assembly ATPase SufC [Balneolaceae bacterium]MDA0735891.1 Fe-S cluster assembly ATPase SufC [Bacteroidota bacterium]OUX47670.1 MAG: Fe-S cluster assembly ATPase SufC [Bacteroidetes bacterium TMED284]PDH56776.1 MAG: Fe-S cluster assembly ATPase SufC [Rhodothermaeota bacterium MED-G12]
MLEIRNLHAVVEGEELEILKGVNLTVNKGEIHAIMGPNGSGKSTLSKVVSGHPEYEVTEGTILFEGEDITEMDADERAHLGLFLAFQYPVEVPGITNKTLLREAYNTIARANEREELDPLEFEDYLVSKLEIIEMKDEFLNRSINTGFSGGEKKKNEIFQMAVLNPRLSFLDETDSGLDIDALKVVSDGVNKIASPENAIVMITHYQRLLNYIKPDFVHVMMNGKIVKSGDISLAEELEANGYDQMQKELA